MAYKIETKEGDFGLILTIRFPEADVDEKALNTIQRTPPDFLVPFRHKSVNGEIVCDYQIGSSSLLKYHYEKERSTLDYVHFWEQILQPLADCEDWFMNPFSFVLDTEYLYTNKGKIMYLYVPALRRYSDMDSLRRMATELARENSSRDKSLYSDVLVCTTQNFRPSELLQMLRSAQPEPSALKPDGPAEQSRRQTAPAAPVSGAEPAHRPSAPAKTSGKEPYTQISGGSAGEPGSAGDLDRIYQELLGPKNGEGGTKSGGGKKPGLISRIFKRKNDDAVYAGAGSQTEGTRRPPDFPPHGTGTGTGAGSDHASVFMPVASDPVTTIPDASFVLLAGGTGLPGVIPVSIQPGRTFTIGRNDVAVGRKQSDFEFDGATEGVSRKHAAVERQKDGSYMLVDLGSTYGTFVDNKRLSANVKRRLTRGCRVAFGTAGAEYLWEE